MDDSPEKTEVQVEHSGDRNPGGDKSRGGRSMERRVDGRNAGRTGGGRSESRRRLHGGTVERGECGCFPTSSFL